MLAGLAHERSDGSRTRHPEQSEGSCDRHGHNLGGESPPLALERREYVAEDKGVRRNHGLLPQRGKYR